MINGEERILYILDDNVYVPIACLTSNSFNESVEMLDTTTRLSGGWKTSRPNAQSFSVEFEGIQTYDFDNKVSYIGLKEKKRGRELLTFKITDLNEEHSEIFKGYITELGESAAVEEFVTFNGTIQGFGMPETVLNIIPDSWIFLNNSFFTTLNGDTLQFI